MDTNKITFLGISVLGVFLLVGSIFTLVLFRMDIAVPSVHAAYMGDTDSDSNNTGTNTGSGSTGTNTDTNTNTGSTGDIGSNSGSTGGTVYSGDVTYEESDLNDDGCTSLYDFVVFTEYYQQTGDSLAADYNGDGVVNVIDFSTFAASYIVGNQDNKCT
jgi:hypothetical protein